MPDDGYYDPQTLGFKVLAQSLAAAGRELREFRAAPAPDSRILRQMAKQNDGDSVVFQMPLSHLSDSELTDLTKVLRHSRTFSLSLSSEWFFSTAHIINEGYLRRILSNMTSSQDLKLQLDCALVYRCLSYSYGSGGSTFSLRDVFGNAVFTSLRSLSLGHFWPRAEELLAFLLKHSSSLEILEFRDTKLTQTVESSQSIDLEKLDTDSHLDDGPSEGWQSIAEACREIPKLRGILIFWCRSRVVDHWGEWNLGTAEEIRLMELAMDGRPNVYQELIENMRHDPMATPEAC